MKKLPEVNPVRCLLSNGVNVSFGELYSMLVAPIRSKLLLTGIELKVFNQLSKPKSAEGVAESLGTHPVNTRLFLDGLAAINLLEKKDGLYQNVPITQTFLVEGSPTYLGQFFTNQLQWHKSVLNDLSKLIMEGPPTQSETGTESEEVWAQMAVTMANYERSGIAQNVVRTLKELPEFPSFTKMLDLGGGPGLI